MSAIPSSLGRVPNVLAAQMMLGSLNRTNQNLLDLQVQLATGRQVNRPSDNPVAASTIGVLDDLIERREQVRRNLSHAQALLGTSDAALGDATDLLHEARQLALSQIGVGSDSQTRANQAHVIDAILKQMTALANRDVQGIHLFAGAAAAGAPLTELLGGLRYQGRGEGVRIDLGSLQMPVTLSGHDAFGTLSARVQGDRDLNPAMTAATRLAELGGATGVGVAPGAVDLDVNGTMLQVDLSSAHTVGDVISTLQSAIQAVDAGAAVSIDPATGDRLRITAAAGPITISDPGAPATAASLGIAATFPVGATAGQNVNPRLTDLTPLSLLNGVSFPLGTVRISNGGQTRDVDLSAAQTVQDLVNAIESLNIGVRVEIAATGDRLNFINELSGSPARAMSISEVGGGTTATELGVRSFAAATLLADFNHGRGVSVVTGSTDPVTGLPDPARDVDFRITLRNGLFFDVDLSSESTVQQVMDAITTAATTAGVAVPAQFTVALAADGNGLQFTDGTSGVAGATFAVTALNGSFAAADLGILGSTTGATFTGEDRATVAVDGLFTHLTALRDALLGNDERGIEVAASALDDDLTRLVQARATVGVRSRRVDDALAREEDLMIQDQSLRSLVQDLDVTAASIRFAQLQQQLQAGLATASRVTSLTLLDFLGP